MAYSESFEQGQVRSQLHDRLDAHSERATNHLRQSRSCTECCRRKVRCDRTYPCRNCARHNSTCVFPTSRKAAHRSQKPARSSKTTTAQDPTLSEFTASATSIQAEQEIAAPSQDARRSPSSSVNRNSISSHSAALSHDRDYATQLNLAGGRSRYVGNQFWVSMSEEVEEMRDVLDDSSQDAEVPLSHDATKATIDNEYASRTSYMFSPLSSTKSLHALLPDPEQLLTMFDTYQDNVDPVARIFHQPYLRKLVNDTINTPGQVDKNVMTVLFSLCFAAITSVDEVQCMKTFGETQQKLLVRYRFAVEQSLAHAGFVESLSFSTLAALVLFLLCVRRYDQSRYVSGMLGIAIRNAQAMGLHKDGTRFKISPYETEMRRRLWWHICILDLRSAEDHGFEPTIFEHNYDTKFPVNLDDDDLHPEATQLKPEKIGYSSMTFSLLRCEMTVAIKRLHYQPPGAVDLMPMDKEGFVGKVDEHFHNTYINHCDISKSIEWVSATWARLMLAKLWLAAYNPLQRGGEIIPLQSRRLAFVKAVDVLKLADALESSPRATRWRWLFLTHTQWQAVIFVLAYLCVTPGDPLAGQAWSIVSKVYDRWSARSSVQEGTLWKPLSQLMTKAQQLQPSMQTVPQSSSGELSSTRKQSDNMTEHRVDHTQLPEPKSRQEMMHDVAQDSVTMPSLSEHISQSDYSARSPTGLSEPTVAVIDSTNLGHDPGLNVHDFASDILSSDWDTLMHDLHFDPQCGEDTAIPPISDIMQRNLANVWDTL